MKAVHAEIEYESEHGWVHSDICPPDHSAKGLSDMEWRQFLHDCLDEWLSKSQGSGMFYVCEERYLRPGPKQFEDEEQNGIKFFAESNTVTK